MKPLRPCLTHRCPRYGPSRARRSGSCLVRFEHKRIRHEGGSPGTAGGWRKARKRAPWRDHDKCTACGSSENLTVYHLDGSGIVGGNHALSNLVTLSGRGV